jgi:predicted nucleotidyltransferase
LQGTGKRVYWPSGGGPDSDLDFLVEFSRPVGLFEFVELKHALEKILQCEVDLVTPDALRESMKAAILEEAIDVTP